MKFYLSLVFLILSSCSSYSLNKTKGSNFSLKGGVVGNKKWSDSLKFKRTSWYKGTTMFFDVSIASLDKNSPFLNWLSSAEVRERASCKHFYLVLSYAHDPELISNKSFLLKLIDQGYSRVSLNSFSKNLKLHPEFSYLFNNYSIYGICHPGPISIKKNKPSLMVSFPGFTSINII